MADNNAPAPLIKPLVEARPGDPITAGRWNEMQSLMRSEHVQHSHTGVWKGDLFDGAPITSAGLANGAVTGPRIADRTITGDKIDPATDIRARDITATGTLKAAALDLGETDELVLRARDLKFGHSSRRQTPGRALVDLATGDPQKLGLNPDGDWKDGVKIGGDLQLTGNLTAERAVTVTGNLSATTATFSGALTANNGATLTGTVTANNGLTVGGAALTAKNGLSVAGAATLAELSVTGTLKASTFSAEAFTTSDLKLGGQPGRRVKGPGRALVDWKSNARESLVLNFEADWAGGVDIQSPLAVTGATTLQSTLAVTGATTLQSTLAVTGNATVKGRQVATAEGSDPPRMVHGYVQSDLGLMSGTGYTAEHNDNGFKIRFVRSFKSFPTVIVQQHGNGDTRDNALVVSVSPSDFQVYTGNSSGTRERRNFFFLAIGPAAD